MTREEQIKEYANSFKGKGMESDELKEIVRLAIIDGAKWADAHPHQPSLHSNIDEEITSNPEYCPKLQTQYSLYQKTLYEIATILSKYEDKDGSPLEQIRFIVINDTIDKMEKYPEVDLKKEIDELWESLNTGHDYVIVDSYQDFIGICLHCFELGINARKEE